MATENRGIRQLMDMVVSESQARDSKMAEREAIKQTIIATLGALGGMQIDTETDILFKGQKIILPEVFEGRLLEVARYLRDYHTAQEKHYEYGETFPYRPYDGAHAFQNVLKNLFGSTGLGKNRPATFFSPEKPPQMLTIPIGVGKTTQVPWGEIDFPQLECTFRLNSVRDVEKGNLFHLSVDAPKKFNKQVAALFELVKQELKNNSIYKGHAINGAQNPEFLDLSNLDPSKVIYNAEVLTQLGTNLWGLLRHTDKMRELGIPLKRAVLLEGPYGTGKTLAGTLTAKEAEQNGWTYILCRPGDDLYAALKTAQLYAPAVVWFEDIDKLAKGGTDEEISTLLDALDGAQNKGHEVVAGFTTNFVDRIQKGVLRPGRLDAIIHIGELDAEGYRKLVRNLIKPELLGEIDYDLLIKAFAGFMPAFVTEAINGSLRAMVTRTNGHPEKVNTDDIVNSALSLRRQLDLMNNAGEGANAPTIDSLVQAKLENVINHAELGYDKEGETQGLRYNKDREVSDEDDE